MRTRILQWILLVFLIPADLLFLFSRNRDVIQADLKRISDENPYKSTGLIAFNYLFILDRPFRTIFYYRTKKSIVLRSISKLFFRPLITLEIMGDIAQGLRISHNYGVIHPLSAGKNLFVGHGVTIGKGKANSNNSEQIYPIIGDNVSIYANAIVFGGIKIGNNVNIGAGAVVNFDIPDNCTVVGNPARVITK